MDKADSTIKFHCKNCGYKFSAPSIQTGKKCKCPKCKNMIVVPEIQTTSSVTEQNNSRHAKTSSESSTYDLALLDMPQKDKTQDLPLNHNETTGNSAKYNQEPEEE